MTLNTRQAGPVTVLEISGRFDAHVSPTVDQWITENLPAALPLVINFEGTTFVDSSALAVLVKAFKRTQEHQGKMALCNLQKPVQIILELTRMDKVFSIFDDETSALASVNAV